jgi:hypothetical protein
MTLKVGRHFALWIGLDDDLERADMDSGGTDDGVKLPMSKASSGKDVLRVCSVRFSRVRGSAHP